VDNGTELTPKAPQKWAYRRDATLELIRSGQPAENGFIEAINDKLRPEYLKVNQLLSIDHARSKIEAWQLHYNLHRPHSPLGQLTPRKHLTMLAATDEEAAIFQP
jgi:putative transposase